MKKDKISESFEENGNLYRMVNGKKIGQILEKTEKDRQLNADINFWRMREGGGCG